VASLSLTLQSTTFAGQQSLLIWERQPADGTGELDFSLWFVQGTDQEDAGIAASKIQASPSQQSGSVQVVFPDKGSYVVIAVDDSGDTIATSNNILAITSPTSTTASASTLPSASSSSKPTGSGTSSTRQQNKVPVIVGSVIGSLILLAILAALAMVLIRRRRNNEAKRWTFHRDMMVQHCQQPVAPTSASSVYSSSTFPEDLEQGTDSLPPPVVPSTRPPSPDAKPRIPDPVVYPTRVAGLLERRPTIRRLDLDPYRSPIGPRPPLIHPASLTPSSTLYRSASARPMSPIPRSPSPRTHRQRAIADQIEILRIQMLEIEREGVKDHIGMSEMAEKMAWLRDQQEGSWALGLTEVAPHGYDRYMS